MTATNYQKARESMVVSQLEPSGITDKRIVEAYREVPREAFLPEGMKAVAYLDESIQLGNGHSLLEPLLHASMVKELNIQSSDKVLDIGDVTGYSAAILSKLSDAVSVWNGQNAPATYDCILLNGAVAEIPDALMSQLNAGGRVAAIVVPGGKAIGQIVVATREDNGTISKQILDDAVAAYLPGLEPKQEFIF